MARKPRKQTIAAVSRRVRQVGEMDGRYERPEAPHVQLIRELVEYAYDNGWYGSKSYACPTRDGGTAIVTIQLVSEGRSWQLPCYADRRQCSVDEAEPQAQARSAIAVNRVATKRGSG